MSWQIAFGILTGIVLLQVYLTARIAARLGGFRTLLMTPVRVWRPGHGIAAIGRRIRPIRCDAHTGGSGEGREESRIDAEAVVIVADVRSVAARRMAQIVAALWSVSPCPVPWSWYLAGSAEQVERFVRDVAICGACHHRTSPRAAYRASARGIPLAIYVDRTGVVRQIGFLADGPGLAAFVNGCANSALRRWARATDEEHSVSLNAASTSPEPLPSPG